MKERVTVVTGEQGAFVADTLTADLTFYANGAVADRVGGAGARSAASSEGDMVRYAIPKRGAAAGRARGVPRRGARQGRPTS